jgi:hypothetical protein
VLVSGLFGLSMHHYFGDIFFRTIFLFSLIVFQTTKYHWCCRYCKSLCGSYVAFSVF